MGIYPLHRPLQSWWLWWWWWGWCWCSGDDDATDIADDKSCDPVTDFKKASTNDDDSFADVFDYDKDLSHISLKCLCEGQAASIWPMQCFPLSQLQLLFFFHGHAWGPGWACNVLVSLLGLSLFYRKMALTYALGGCDRDNAKQKSLNSKLNLLKLIIAFDSMVGLFTQFFNTIIFSFLIINPEGAILYYLIEVIVRFRPVPSGQLSGSLWGLNWFHLIIYQVCGVTSWSTYI